MPPKTHLGRILAIVGGLLAYLLAGFGVAQHFRDTPLLAQSIATMPGVILYGWLYWKDREITRVRIPIPLPRILLWILPWLFLVLNWAANPIVPIPLGPPHTLNNGSQVLLGILFCLLIGLGEELIFRGYLFSLCKQWSPAVALLVTSLLFGACHVNHGVSITTLALPIGFGFGLARLAGTPLWLLAVLHGLIDLPVEFPHSETPPWVNYPGWAIFAFAMLVTIAFLAFPRHWTKWAAVSQSTSAPLPPEPEVDPESAA